MPRSTTFVSPATIDTPAAPAAAAMEAAIRRRSATGNPSSRMNPADRNAGRAPHIARSFTVPLTARSPMSPPGKNSGETTNESVVNAARAQSSDSVAPSSSAASTGLRNASRNTASISVCVALPPAP